MNLSSISLKNTIVGLILFITLIPLIFIVPWISNKIYTIERDLHISLQIEQNQHIKNEIINELARIKSALKSKTDALTLALDLPLTKQKVYINILIKKIISQESAIHSILLVDNKSNLIVEQDNHFLKKSAILNPETILKTYFSGSFNENSPYLAIPLLKRDYISSIAYNETHDNRAIFNIALPILNTQDEVIAILIAAIEPSKLWLTILSKIKKDNIFHYIVDGHGVYMHKSPYFSEGDFATDIAIVRGVLQNVDWKPVAHYLSISGKEVYGVSSRVPQLDWGIISEVPVESIILPIKKNLYFIILSFIISSLIIIVLSIITVNKIFHPLKKLTSAFKELEHNKYPKLSLSYFSELNILESGFNSMTYNREKHENMLKKSIKEIENSRRLAEQANYVKSEFIANMSHELRTPLNAILGFSQLLQEDETLQEEQLLEVGYIYDAGKHLLGLVNDIMDLEKIKVNQVSLSITNISLSKIIQKSELILKEMLKEKSIKLNYQYEELNLVTLKADELRLKQVLVNILSNAIKYNKKNGEIFIKTHLLSNDMWRIEIIDTGIGITEDKINQLFTPFDRLGLENSGIPGTGIGLVITKNLIELMQGHIGVNSQPNDGTTFWIELKRG